MTQLPDQARNRVGRRAQNSQIGRLRQGRRIGKRSDATNSCVFWIDGIFWAGKVTGTQIAPHRGAHAADAVRRAYNRD